MTRVPRFESGDDMLAAKTLRRSDRACSGCGPPLLVTESQQRDRFGLGHRSADAVVIDIA
jgi:hypothetical protein